MLQILKEEGYHIKERELMRVRAKNRWLLRVPNGTKSRKTPDTNPKEDSEEGAAFRERIEKREAESAELWASRKRRRRTRGWAGLPADPPGPPRFPSETTIDESKQYLNLDKSLYREIRNHFQRICEEAGFLKKTIAGTERWQAAKNRLIRESPHLQAIFWSGPNQLDAKALALDIVCTDVTKRMRTLERRMTIAEAKNALGINPEESRQIKNAFYNILQNNHFTSKLEAGDDQWKELKDQWIRESGLLQNILAPGYTDSEHATKSKALEVLCRDVMKRFRDDQTKRHQRGQDSASESPYHMALSTGIETGCEVSINKGISTLASQALASAPIVAADLSDIQIDPSLLQAANHPSFALLSPPGIREEFSDVDRLLGSTFPASIHLQVKSDVSESWITRLTQPSFEELRQLIGSRYPNGVLGTIKGIGRSANNDNEQTVIDDDAKLEAYLMQAQGETARFEIFLDSTEKDDK